MGRLRASVAAVLVSAMGVVGTTLLTAGPANAGGENTTMTCSSETTASFQFVFRCTASDPDGVRTVVVGATSQAVLTCSPGANTSYTFTVPDDNTRHTVSITDCEQPRQRAKFVIRPNGTVVGPTFGPGASV
jgi:hypothetical protein